MARPLRTHFAAPFVIVVAGCGGSKSTEPRPPPDDAGPRWTVRRDGDQCSAMLHVKCPPPEVGTCNPPGPMRVACPDGIETTLEVVEVKPGRCVVAGGNRVVRCPSPEPEPPPLTADAAVATAPLDAGTAIAAAARRGWDVRRQGDACQAQEDACRGVQVAPGQPIPRCNPPPPSKIDCPATDVIAIVEISPGRCQTRSQDDCPPDKKCNPPPPEDIACPR